MARGVSQCGRIRHRWARRDRGRIVARNIRNRQRHDLGGALSGARQPAALDARQMLADGVDLADRRAERNSARVTCCFWANENASHRCDPVGRAAAGQQHQQEIIGLRTLGQFQAVLGTLQTGLVGHGMAGLDHPDPPRRQAMAVAGGGDADQSLRRKLEGVEIVPARRRSPWRRRPCRRRDKSPAPWARGANAPRARHRDVRPQRRHRRSRAGKVVGRSSRHGIFKKTTRELLGCPLSIRLPQKETPRA